MTKFRTYLTLILLLFTSFAFSQEMKVKSMDYAEFGLAARTKLRTDINGDTCALVRVHLANPDAKFEGNIAYREYDSSEYLVYMSPGSKRMKIKVEGYLPLTVDFSKYDIKSVESRQTYVLVIELPAISTYNSSIMRNVKFSVSPIESKLKINNLDFVLKNGKVDVPLNEGVHTYTVSCDYYVSETKTFIVDQNHEEVNISLKPLYSTLTVTSSIPDAEVFVDNNNVGKTPLTFDIIGGVHEVKIQKEGYKTDLKEIDIKSTSPMTIHSEFSTLIDVVLDAAVPDAKLSFNNKYVGEGSAKVTEVAGDYPVNVSAKGYYEYKGTVHIDGTLQTIKLKMKKRFFNSTGGYVSAGFSVGSSMGIQGTLGMNIHDFNIEGNYTIGLKDSEEIFWNSTSTESMMKPSGYTYKSSTIAGKFGRAFTFDRFRVCPQIGLSVSLINGVHKTEGTTIGVDKTYVASGTAGADFQLALTSYLGIRINPSYNIAISKGKEYDKLAEISKTIKGMGTGFKCNMGLVILF